MSEQEITQVTQKLEELNTSNPPSEATKNEVEPQSQAAPEPEEKEEEIHVKSKELYERQIVDIDVLRTDPNSPLYSQVKSFEELKLKDELLRAISDLGYHKPSQIQEKALPIILAKRPDGKPENLIGQAQSGTGKTAAFSLGLLSRVDENVKEPQALIVSPTRELARQIQSAVQQMGKYLPNIQYFLALATTAFHKPGDKHRKPTKATKASKEVVKQQVVIGTPGRVADLEKKKQLSFKNMRIFILDEADQLLNEKNGPALANQTRDILKKITQASPNVQILFFSATWPPHVMRWAEEQVPEPRTTIKVNVKEISISEDLLKQFYIPCTDSTKFDVLVKLYGFLNVGQSIIFVEGRNRAQNLTQQMRDAKHTVSLIHGGDMDPQERDRVIDEFRSGKTKVLIATDVLSRGIDILQVTLVINYDLPVFNGKVNYENYLHRVGRTARFGQKGIAISLAHDERSIKHIESIVELYKKKIEKIEVSQIGRVAIELKNLAKA